MRHWIVAGLIFGVLSVWLAVGVNGCGSEMLTGIGIGAGTSTALTEGQRLAQQSKAALIAELMETRAALADADDPAEKERLSEEVKKLEEKEFYANMTENISGKVTEGLNKEWGTQDPEKQRENYMWLLDAGLGLLFALQYRKNKAKEKGEAKFAAESDPKVAKQLYDDVKKYDSRWIP